MKKLEKILSEISGRLAILELACMSLGCKDVARIRENLIDASDYGYALSKFVGEIAELTSTCNDVLDEYYLTLQCNVQESSEKKGA